MSELDLGSTPTAAPTATAGTNPGALVLAPPAPVVVVEKEQALGAIPLDETKKSELQTKAAQFVEGLAALDPHSPEFATKVTQITTMGDNDMRAAAAMSNRMLERPAAAMGKGKGGGDAQVRVSNTLVDLRHTVTDLDPNRADLSGVKKVMKWLPGGDKVDRYFDKYRSAQSHLDAIIKALASGQDELRKDNAAIETEKANMWTTMGKISEYNELAGALDSAVENKVAQLEASGKVEDANIMRSDALFPIRQRRQDLMTQMAVNVQGYLALDLIRKNNIELIKGVDRAQTTTIAALRIAVIVSQALSRQKLVLDQINALNTVTSNLIESTSEQLKLQGAAINQQAASSTIEVAKLQAAFDNVFATMDAIDTFRAQAVESMGQTVTALEGQIERAKPYLERTRRGEVSGSGQ
ncbi:toxic anion resistance protein [Jatrophihabitans telluris]|uniref:Toxic anion resistance protein n=1 Tax=Jatrophihabitans telluris TaxID=2038343 RepID=A0ABY4R473_9ACTN|nr:toxic anion resistance protein [Jatrophihabitans telluris]UQX90257.1 toxic anion resistance protein [Jatrophihabitans telluris]